MAVSPIRVAFLGKNAARAGTQRITGYLLKHLNKEQFQPILLLPRGGPLLAEYRQHAPVHVYEECAPPRRARLLDPLFSRFNATQFVRDIHSSMMSRKAARHQQDWAAGRLKEFQPHVIVRMYNTSIGMFDAGNARPVPQVQQFTASAGIFHCNSPVQMAKALASASSFICEGVGVRDELHRCWGVPLERIHIVCLGIDLALRDEQMARIDRPIRASLNLPDDALIIGSMGSWHYTKGVDLWVEAAARLRARYPDRKLMFLWIGGKDSDRASVYGRSVLSLIRELGLHENVVIVGDQAHVYPYLDMCDIYVQPSRTDAFPHATLEAMGMSKPVVAFSQGVGLEDYAQESLIRVDTVSSEALAEGIISLIDNPDLRARLGQHGLRLVSELLDLPNTVRCYERVLRQASQ